MMSVLVILQASRAFLLPSPMWTRAPDPSSRKPEPHPPLPCSPTSLAHDPVLCSPSPHCGLEMYFLLLLHGTALLHRTFFSHLDFCTCLASLSLLPSSPRANPFSTLLAKSGIFKNTNYVSLFPSKTSQRLPTALRIKSKLLSMATSLLSSFPRVLTYIALQNQSHTSTCLSNRQPQYPSRRGSEKPSCPPHVPNRS